jgi:hypothetical protein
MERIERIERIDSVRCGGSARIESGNSLVGN